MNTVYHWPVDPGPSTYAVLVTVERPSGTSGGFVEDLRFSGPSKISGPLGTAIVKMSGLGWAARRTLSRIGVDGFYSCIEIVGDQTRFSDLVLSGCYYGMYWTQPSPILFGDLLFERLIVTNHQMAALAVHPNATIGENTFISCIFGVAPFAIYKETGGNIDEVVHGCTFLNCQFENVGISMIGEDNIILGTPRRAAIYNTKFIHPEFGWGEYGIKGIQSKAINDVNQAHLMDIEGFREPELWHPPASNGTVVFSISSIILSSISGDAQTLINSPKHEQAFLHSDSPSGLQIHQLGAHGWIGAAYLLDSSSPAVLLQRGTIVAFTNDSAYLHVHATSNDVHEMIAGVIINELSIISSVVIVACEGVVSVRTAGEVGGLIAASTGGMGVAAKAGWGSLPNFVIGLALAGTTRNNLTTVKLAIR